MNIKTNHLKLATHWTDRESRGRIEAETAAARPLADYRKNPLIRSKLPGQRSGDYISEHGAREGLDTAMRTVRFMDATGANDSRAWRSIFGGRAYGMLSGCSPSGFDHTAVWTRDRAYLVTTEPYNGAAAAIAWCNANGWECAERLAWGMWNPPGTTLLLCTPPKRGADLEAILRHLDAATPIPVEDRARVGTVKTWPRRSAA